jgi:hypothetical protein
VDPIKDGANWFAYVNNDPVNYTDLWGLRPVKKEERDAYTNATGRPIDFDKIDIIDGRLPTVDELNSAAASVGLDPNKYSEEQKKEAVSNPNTYGMSLPNGTIYMKDAKPSVEDVVHELDHQQAYQNGATVTYGGQTKSLTTPGAVFEALINEDLSMADPYRTPGTLEYRAEQARDAAKQQQQNTNRPQGADLKGS